MIIKNASNNLKFSIPALSLLPIALFLVIFIMFGVLSDSGRAPLSPTVAIIPAIILAFIWRPRNFKENLDVFMAGVGHNNILIMCFVFLFSGAFSQVMLSIGGIDASVNFALHYIPSGFVLPGIFIVSSFISLAMGTSMGTVAAVTPIAVGLCKSAGIPLPVGVGAVLSGAMFGDNLSIISDTTIAAVQTQGCEMKDKFKMNFIIAIPAMIASVLVLSMFQQPDSANHIGSYNFLKVLPYVAVLLFSLLGFHVYLILLLGIVFGGVVGFYEGDYSVLDYTAAIYQGFGSMQEILVLSLFIGGLSELIKHQGGLALIIKKMLAFSTCLGGKKKQKKIVGELSISSLVSLADVCTANNTISILVMGEASRDIGKLYGIHPTRVASLLDIFSCVFQGILPYSAQVLLAASISGISPLSLIWNVHYCYFLGLAAIISILFRYPQK